MGVSPTPARRALLALHDVVAEELREALRFDRPEGEKTAEHDGELRPVWMSAYRQGRPSFEYLGTTYPVYDGDGRPWCSRSSTRVERAKVLRGRRSCRVRSR